MPGLVRIAVTVLLIVPASLSAQPPAPMASSGTVGAALLSAYQRYARNMPGAADLMPADKFSYKPTPAQMSFGEIMAHEASANESVCAAMAGGAMTPNESAAGATAPKDQLVDRLRKSFETCAAIVAKLPDSALGDSVPFFGGRKATKARAAIALAQDWADHYAQASMYLRLNGILPPSAQPRK